MVLLNAAHLPPLGHWQLSSKLRRMEGSASSRPLREAHDAGPWASYDMHLLPARRSIYHRIRSVNSGQNYVLTTNDSRSSLSASSSGELISNKHKSERKCKDGSMMIFYTKGPYISIHNGKCVCRRCVRVRGVGGGVSVHAGSIGDDPAAAVAVAACCCCSSSYTCHPKLFFIQQQYSSTYCQYFFDYERKHFRAPLGSAATFIRPRRTDIIIPLMVTMGMRGTASGRQLAAAKSPLSLLHTW